MAKRIRQAGVVAVKNGRVCLITSSSGKRWLVPKGNRQSGCDLRETAAREAWEEAGLVGRIKSRPLGTYEFVKFGRPHEVVVFHMSVREAKPHWPERNKRRRRWLRPTKARERIGDRALRAIVASACGRGARAA